MNINPSAAASVAGTARAAARGGESDNQATESTNRNAASEKPAGKAGDATAVDAGDQTGDRGGNGRQVLDVFESSDDENQQETTEKDGQPKLGLQEGAGNNIDLEA